MEKEATVETEKEVKQVASVKTEKEAKQDMLDKTQIEAKQEASSSDENHEMEVDHSFLANPYHNAIVLGIVFFSSRLPLTIPHGVVKAVILGLGAGVLPMYLKKYLPLPLKILVVESEPVIVDVVTKYFGFKQDENLTVYISDGIEAVESLPSKADILVLDVASTDTSSGLSCPGEGYVENSFLLNAKESLSEDGMFVMNMISRCSPLKVIVYSRLKKVFDSIFRVEIEKDVSEVIFALKTEAKVSVEELMQNFEANIQLATSLGIGDEFTDFTKLIKKIK